MITVEKRNSSVCRKPIESECPICHEKFISINKLNKHRKETKHYNYHSTSKKLTEEEKIIFRKKLLDVWNKNGHWPTGRAATEERELERRRKLSISMKKYGGKRTHSGRGKQGRYKGYWCDSSWELAYVIYNIDHNINFKRSTKEITYTFNNEQHKYYPDFELDDGTLIEIKGYETDQWNEKKKECIKKYNLLVLNEITIKPYLDYVIHTYGKNYVQMYE